MNHKYLNIAAAALVLGGLAILSDTLVATKVKADPVATCDCKTPASSTKRCITETNYTICDGQGVVFCQSTQNGSTSLSESPIVFLTANGLIPDGCSSTTNKVNCGTESIQCYRRTRCTWNAGTGKCENDAASQTGPITNADRRKSEDCAQGVNCSPE